MQVFLGIGWNRVFWIIIIHQNSSENSLVAFCSKARRCERKLRSVDWVGVAKPVLSGCCSSLWTRLFQMLRTSEKQTPGDLKQIRCYRYFILDNQFKMFLEIQENLTLPCYLSTVCLPRLQLEMVRKACVTLLSCLSSLKMSSPWHDSV